MAFGAASEGFDQERPQRRIHYLPVDREAALLVSQMFDQAVEETPGPTVKHPNPSRAWQEEFGGLNPFQLMANVTEHKDLKRFDASYPNHVALLGPAVDDLEPGATMIPVNGVSLSSDVHFDVPRTLLRQKDVPRGLLERIRYEIGKRLFKS